MSVLNLQYEKTWLPKPHQTTRTWAGAAIIFRCVSSNVSSNMLPALTISHRKTGKWGLSAESGTTHPARPDCSTKAEWGAASTLPQHCIHTFAPHLTGQCQSMAGIYGNCFLQSSRKENGLTQPGYSAGFFLDRAAAAMFVSPKCAVRFPFCLSVWIRGNKKGWEAVRFCLFQSRPH